MKEKYKVSSIGYLNLFAASVIKTYNFAPV